MPAIPTASDNNQEWADRIIRRVDPGFKHHWQAYEDRLHTHLVPDCVWIDCGSGDNRFVAGHAGPARLAVGVDLTCREKPEGAFVVADIRHLPFASKSADLVTLRFVVEHFAEVAGHFDEIERILKDGGTVIILTTNALSPLIFIPRFLLPYPIKNRLLAKLFKVESTEIFPTHHKLNTPGRFEHIGGLRLRHLELISDLNFIRKWVFWIFLGWHLVTRPRSLHKLRMHILAELERPLTGTD